MAGDRPLPLLTELWNAAADGAYAAMSVVGTTTLAASAAILVSKWLSPHDYLHLDDGDSVCALALATLAMCLLISICWALSKRLDGKHCTLDQHRANFNRRSLATLGVALVLFVGLQLLGRIIN